LSDAEEKKGKSGGLGRKLWWIHSVYALLLGVAVMFFARRGFEYARWLILMACGLGLLLVVFFRLFGVGVIQEERRDGSATSRVGFVVMTYFMKNLYQAMLFFLLPYYYRSATFGTANMWYVALLAFCALLATLDLVFDNLLVRTRVVSSVYFILALFAACNLALPAWFVGLSTRWTILGATFFSIVAFWALHVSPRRWLDKRVLVPLGAALALGLGAAVFGGRAIPPVPHYVLKRGIGPSLSADGDLSWYAREAFVDVAGHLVAVTHVMAPGHSADDFVHVWRHDGEEVVTRSPSVLYRSDRPDVAVLASEWDLVEEPLARAGKWSVEVRTADDRLVGRVRFRLRR